MLPEVHEQLAELATKLECVEEKTFVMSGRMICEYGRMSRVVKVAWPSAETLVFPPKLNRGNSRFCVLRLLHVLWEAEW